MLDTLFDTTGFPARWNCGLWTSTHGWVHIISDFAIWGAYMSIPLVLAFFLARRRDIPFPRIFILFGLFIFGCGTTHLVEGVIFWHPLYRLSGLLKAMTAIVSWVTVFALIPIIPQALALPGLAKVNLELEKEIASRKQTEADLAALNNSLETRVNQRTAELQKYQSRLRELATEITLVEQRQRRKVASDLHDNLAQMLAVCKMKLGSLPRASVDAQKASIADVVGYLDQSIHFTRTLMSELSPPYLYDFGLLRAVQWLAKAMSERQHLAITIEHEGVAELDEDARTMLFQSIRELLINVAKHSGASAATVRITARADAVVITVSDAGRGFEPASLTPSDDGGFGLFAIRERLWLSGGTTTIDSAPGRGTTVTLTLPLAQEPAPRQTQQIVARARQIADGEA